MKSFSYFFASFLLLNSSVGSQLVCHFPVILFLKTFPPATSSNSVSNFYFAETGRKKGKQYKSKTVTKQKRKRTKSKRSHYYPKRKNLTILIDEDHKSTQPESISPVQMIPYTPLSNIVDLRDKIIINNGECFPEFDIEKGNITSPWSPFIAL